MKCSTILSGALLVMASCVNLRAAIYTLQPIADTRAINYPGYQPLNFGTEILSVYTLSANQNTQRTFIQFDLSSITLATNESISSATLTLTALTAYGNNNTHEPMEVYRMLSPWTETGLSWLNRDATHAWTNAGGDFVGISGQPYAVSTNSPANGQPVTWDVATLVQEWMAGVSTNYGLMLKSYEGNRLSFGQRETLAASQWPSLTVVTGLAPLHANFNGGQVVLWWIGSGVLQEKTDLNPAILWGDSGRSVVQSNGTNSVTISAPTGNRFFRLRSPP
jgi:hypothetical protein